MTDLRRQTASWLSALLCACAAHAQAPVAVDTGADKTIALVRDDSVPIVDGVLDEDVWRHAAVVTDLHQVEPVEFAEASEHTEVRIFYGDDALYVGARLDHTDIGDITAQVLRQGEGLGSEDRFVVILDPYLERRSGYRFQVNPNGVRWDAIYQNTSNLESNWEGIWEGAATRDGAGWTAEMAIPFKTLSFTPNSSVWGINFARIIQSKDEEHAWVSRNREYNPGATGTATGLTDLQQGRGLDLVTSLSVREETFFANPELGDTSAEPSLDLFYKITPALNGSLTLNTDFSATEVDDRQVNLTRFSLFFPEKRDFFLQDSDIFEFGRIGGGGGRGGNNPAVPDASRRNGLPFFSRRLGLSEAGLPVDIEYGGKLSGRVGRVSIGALAIRQDDTPIAESDDVFVGRFAANVLDESSVGVIMTDGDPQSNLDSSLIGTDFRYRNSRLPGGRLLEGQLWYQETDTEGLEGENRAFGAGISAPNSVGWRGSLQMQQFEENYDPAVGFVNRTGIRDLAANLGHRFRFRDSWLRQFYTGFDGYFVESLETGNIESENYGLRFTFNNNTDDNLFSRIVKQREVLTEDFTIYTEPDGSREVVIPAGDYSFDSLFIGMRSGEQRPVSGGFRFRTGEFYDGDSDFLEANLTWRPSERFSVATSYSVEDIELPQGDFRVRLSSFRVQYVFSSTLSWSNLIQYDNVSENVGVNSRLHWIPEAGREGFVVVNHNVSDADRNDSFHSTNADASIKFSHTWRF